MIEAKVSRHDELLCEASKTNLYPVSSLIMTDVNAQPSTHSTIHAEPSELQSQSADKVQEKENTTTTAVTDELDFMTVVCKQLKPRPVPTVPAVSE